jgi:hypothetical protein
MPVQQYHQTIENPFIFQIIPSGLQDYCNGIVMKNQYPFLVKFRNNSILNGGA